MKTCKVNWGIKIAQTKLSMVIDILIPGLKKVSIELKKLLSLLISGNEQFIAAKEFCR